MAIKITRAEYERKFGTAPSIPPTKTTTPTLQPQMPLLTKTSGGFGTAVKDITVGAGKDLIEGTRSVAKGLQGLGQRIIAGATSKSLPEVQATTGFKSLNSNTPEGASVDESLKSKSRGEQVGKVLSFIGQAGTGFVKSGAQKALQVKRASNIAKKTENHALDLVSPKVTPQVAEEAIKQGRATEPTIFKKSQILPSQRDKDLADSVRDVISRKKTVLQNTDAIDKKIRSIDAGVKDYVLKNKVPFNNNQLKTQLKVGENDLKLVFASDATAERTYKAVVDEFMKHVEKGDTAGLLEARKSFDKLPAVKKLLDSQGVGENVKREVVLTVRRMANNYIAKLLPEGNSYKQDLLRESRMIEVLENIAEKNRGMIGKNNLQILAQRYPILKSTIGKVGLGFGLGGTGVGAGIIASSD